MEYLLPKTERLTPREKLRFQLWLEGKPLWECAWRTGSKAKSKHNATALTVETVRKAKRLGLLDEGIIYAGITPQLVAQRLQEIMNGSKDDRARVSAARELNSCFGIHDTKHLEVQGKVEHIHTVSDLIRIIKQSDNITALTDTSIDCEYEEQP